MKAGSKKKDSEKRKIKNIDAISKNHAAMNYFSKHWNMFKNSFVFDSIMLKLMILDMGFIITLFLSYILVYFFWIKNSSLVSHLVTIITTMQTSTVPTSEIISTWHNLLLSVILMLLLIFFLYVILLSIYSAISYIIITKNKFSLKLFINFICIYSILTIIYLLLLLIIFYLSKNPMFAAWIMILVSLIYLYCLLLMHLITNDGSLFKIFGQGFRNMIKLHNTLPPFIFAAIMFIISMSIIALLFGRIPTLVFIWFLLIIIYLSNWMKRYLRAML